MMKFGLLLLASYVCYTSALPPCVCGRNLLPVCGSDGVSYSNECRLNCEKSKGNTDLHVAKTGYCDSDKPGALKLCICTLEYKPVCGSNGETYPNTCAFDCEKVKNAKLEKVSDGPCPTDAEQKVPEVCTCTRNMKPVCGSDGVSYNNECLLKCAASEQKKDITVARQGRCESHQPAAERLCMCTMDYRPVCGTDGVTYGNQCALDCEKAKNALLEKKSDGECPKDVDLTNVPEVCTSCTKNMKPVCGSDGVSYNNMCLLKCAAAEQKKEITVAREGRCEFDEDECECTRELIPVCGKDGVTYSNKCLMKCAGAEEASQGQC